jgi:hypothetical protein
VLSVFCANGQELVNGTCTPCAQGYYKDNSVDRFSMCTLCPAAFITAGTGGTSLGSCSISEYDCYYKGRAIIDVVWECLVINLGSGVEFGRALRVMHYPPVVRDLALSERWLRPSDTVDSFFYVFMLHRMPSYEHDLIHYDFDFC